MDIEPASFWIRLALRQSKGEARYQSKSWTRPNLMGSSPKSNTLFNIEAQEETPESWKIMDGCDRLAG